MPQPRTWSFLACALGLACLDVVHARAQSGTSTPQATVASAQSSTSPTTDDDDDGVLDLAEPSYRTVNLPTTLRLPRYRASFELVHRFNGNLARKTFGEQVGELFGLDNGASIGIEYRFAVARHVQAIVYRTNIDKTFQFSGKYDVVHQRRSTPLSVSAIAAVEGVDNFKDRYAPSLGAVVSRTVSDAVGLYVTPIWIHNSAAILGLDRDTFVVGVGGRLRVSPTVYVVGEMSPRAAGYAPGKAEFGFAIEKRAGLHVFQLNFTNTQASTFGQVARGGFVDSLYLGFNLARKFF